MLHQIRNCPETKFKKNDNWSKHFLVHFNRINLASPEMQGHFVYSSKIHKSSSLPFFQLLSATRPQLIW